MKTLSVTEEYKGKVAAFASHLHHECLRGYLTDHQDGKPFEQLEPHLQDCANRATRITVHYGKAWVRVDVGDSGRYMVDADGNIVGIKAYGSIRRLKTKSQTIISNRRRPGAIDTPNTLVLRL